MPFEEFKRQEEEAWNQKSPIATLYTLRRIWTEGGTQYAKNDNDIIELVNTDNLSEAVALALETKKRKSNL